MSTSGWETDRGIQRRMSPKRKSAFNKGKESKFYVKSFISCINGLGCENKHCHQRIHGVFDPHQQAFYAKHPIEKQGIAACLYGLFGCCRFVDSGMCPYRHYTMIRPLTPQQMCEAALIVSRVFFKRATHLVQRPMVVWPLTEALYQQRIDIKKLLMPGTATHPLVMEKLKVLELLMTLRPHALWITKEGALYMIPMH